MMSNIYVYAYLGVVCNYVQHALTWYNSMCTQLWDVIIDRHRLIWAVVVNCGVTSVELNLCKDVDWAYVWVNVSLVWLK